MVRGEARHCIDHIVSIATQQAALCAQWAGAVVQR